MYPVIKIPATASGLQFLGLRPNANIGKGMKKSENIQKPQDNTDHHDGIQDRFDRPLHGDEVVDEPQQNTHDDENHQ
jgi:hypothetical protein